MKQYNGITEQGKAIIKAKKQNQRYEDKLKKLDEKRDERKARKLQNKIELNEVRIEVADKESFENAICDYNNKTSYVNLIKNPRIKANGEVYENERGLVIKLENIYVTSNLSELFAGVFEIIYQVRNNLIHGKMNPGDNEYEVVKYCYFVLYDLMSF